MLASNRTEQLENELQLTGLLVWNSFIKIGTGTENAR